MEISQILSENEKEFIRKFANPTAKYLGNNFADYPKANIKDAIDFLHSSQTNLIKELIEEIENMKPQKPYPNANNGYRNELDNEEKIEEKALQKIIDYLKEGVKI